MQLPPLPPRDNIGTTHRLPAVTATPLAQRITALQAGHPDASGHYPLADGRAAFAARLALINSAQRSLDLQYYLWHDDNAGRLLAAALYRAAARGVRVRLLLDDNNTRSLDPLLLTLDAHPNISVRLVNPFMQRRWRILGYLGDFPRLNRRMHNKTFTADGHIAIIGGRNIGDEYFGSGDGVLFADLDTLSIGPVTTAIADDFDRYWNGAAAYPVALIIPGSGSRTAPALPDSATALPDSATARAYLRALDRDDPVARLRDGSLPLYWGPTTLHSDPPDKLLGKTALSATLLADIGPVLSKTTRELIIVSPYFVPTAEGAAGLIAIAGRGVRITILTNSLAASDVAAVHSGYAKYRRLLAAGIRLYELKPGATISASGHGGITGHSGASLHAKSFAADGRYVFVGSFNMDPRSAALNSEDGILIDSPALAGDFARHLAANLPTPAYAVSLDDNGRLQWQSLENGRTVIYTREPASSWLRRSSTIILSWLPVEWLL